MRYPYSFKGMGAHDRTGSWTHRALAIPIQGNGGTRGTLHALAIPIQGNGGVHGTGSGTCCTCMRQPYPFKGMGVYTALLVGLAALACANHTHSREWGHSIGRLVKNA